MLKNASMYLERRYTLVKYRMSRFKEYNNG